MARRKFSIHDRLSKNAGGGVADIPLWPLLRFATPQDLKETFKEKWGSWPRAVVLPLTAPDGLLFPVEGLGEPLSDHASLNERLPDFQSVVAAFAEAGLDIYLLIDPTLDFVRAEPLHIVDIVGDGSHAVCIGNPQAREIIGAILGTGIDIAREVLEDKPGVKLRGVIVDAVNLFPMGATNDRLELTCFCPSCVEYFEAREPGLLRFFKDFPSPWNLLLKDTGTGIAHIDEIKSSSTEEEIIGLSRQKGFLKVFGNATQAELFEQAKLLRRYILIRHDQVIASLDAIFEEALRGIPDPPRRIILLEGVYYGWTAGLLLDRMDRVDDGRSLRPFDEIWFDPRAVYLHNVPYRTYMWRRSRYYIDEFSRAIGTVSDPVRRASTGVARLPSSAAKNLLRNRLYQCMGMEMSGQTALLSLPELRSEDGESQRVGYVGVMLSREWAEQFIETLSIPPGIPDLEEAAEAGRSRFVEMLRGLGRSEREEET